MNPEPQEVNSADLKKLAKEFALEKWTDEASDLETSMTNPDKYDGFIAGYKASQSKLPEDNGDVEQMASEYASYYDTTEGRSVDKDAKKHFIAGCRAIQSKLTGTVFVKRDCRDGKNLPEKRVGSYVVLRENMNGFWVAFWDERYGEYKFWTDFTCGKEYKNVTHWLEETAAPKLYSEEQMRKCLQNYQQWVMDNDISQLQAGQMVKMYFTSEAYNSLQPKQ